MDRLAFSTLGCPEWRLEEAVEAALRFGYQGLELRLLDGEVLPPKLPEREIVRVADALARTSLELICVDTSLRVSKRSDDLAAEGEAYLALAARWGSPYIRVFGGDPAVGLGPDGLEVAADQLRSLIPTARDLGVTVLVETHDVFAESGPLAALMRELDSPHVAVLWDLLHPWRVGEEPQRTLDLLGEHVALVHIKDGVRLPDGKAELRMLNEGDVPTAEALRLLAGRGYDGWLCVEWERKWHPHLAPAEVALSRHAAQLRSLLSRLNGAGRAG